MKIAVCDDDRFYRENMSRLLNLYSERNPQHDLSITIFKCADELCFSNGTVLKLPKKPLSKLCEKWAERQKEELKNEITIEK